MMICNPSCIRGWQQALIPLLSLWAVLCVFGCTTIKDTAKGTARTVSDTSRKVTSALTPSGSDLMHKIALIGLDNQLGAVRSDFGAFFQKTLTEFLPKECPKYVVDAPLGEMLKSPPRTAAGLIDGYALALLGRPRGLNFFVFGTLSDSKLMNEKTGFWLWKDTIFKIRVVLRTEIIDSATGAKVLDETLSEEWVIDELRYEQLQASGLLPFAEIEPILRRLLPEVGYQICTAISRQPWQGFIVSADGGRLTISAGSAVGLSADRRLEVYASGGVVESKDGRRLLKPGERVAEARIVAVSDDQAEATLSPPSAIAAGGTVRLK